MLYSPIKVALAGIAVWCFLWLILPLQEVGYLSWEALIYVALCYAALFLGTFLGGRSIERLPPERWDRPFSPALFWTSLGIGLVGAAMRLFDRAVLRGVEYGADALAFRETLETADVGIIGAIGAAIYSFCLLPMVILMVTKSARPRRFLFAIASVAFLIPMVESLAQLSRTFMLVTIGLGLGAAVIGRFRGNPVHRRVLLIGVAAVMGMSMASTAIFSTRLELSERQLSDSIFDSVYAENLQPGGRARDVLMGGGTAAEERFYRVVLPNGMYYLSGLYEFTLLWDRPDAQPFGWGALHFYPVVRVAQLLDPTFLENVDEVEYVYREGVWQTFFGPLWIDFGWFGVMLMIPVGACMATLATRARNRDLPYLPLYLYGLVIIFFMPVVNLLTSGFGLFTIAAFAAFVPIAKAYSRPLAQRPESNGPVQRAVGQS